ncbi:hypothetical protein ACIQXW_23280 [Lysinibacillus sp. NPDC097162]|uniref:hypothetical protein n=1 Tax=Lysinibacillus sp. NPDC097162 TaxID=3364140 RepID=UPI003814EB11
MRPYDALHDHDAQEITTISEIYTTAAQTYLDYNGSLPSDDDAADYYRLSIRATKVS